MSRVVLSRLWYIFPADDQNLRPEQFDRKVRSYVRTLSPGERRVLLEFLVVQYEAFQKQLELLFAHASVTDQEYHERSERLRAIWITCMLSSRRSTMTPAARFKRASSPLNMTARREVTAHPTRRGRTSSVDDLPSPAHSARWPRSTRGSGACSHPGACLLASIDALTDEICGIDPARNADSSVRCPHPRPSPARGEGVCRGRVELRYHDHFFSGKDAS